MIMTVHPVLVLLPMLGLFVLPCASMHLENGINVMVNKTNGEQCDVKHCPVESCSKAIFFEEQSLCFLISCPNNTQNSSCGNIRSFNDLLAQPEFVHWLKNQTGNFVLPLESSGTNSSKSSPDCSSKITTLSTTEANVSRTSTITKVQNDTTTKATTVLHTTSTEKPAITTTIPATPAMTFNTTTLKPTTPTTTAMTFTTTTTPEPTTANPKPPSATTSTTTKSTTVAQTIIPKQPSSPSPSGTNLSVNISPLVPTTLPSNSSSNLVQTSPIPTSSEEKPMPTMPKTSARPIHKGDQAMVDKAGDPLTSHLLNTSSLLAVLLFGLLFFVVTVGLFLKQAYEL